ncbi:MAG: glycosyltransferase family 2 protein [Salinibacter sp.]
MGQPTNRPSNKKPIVSIVTPSYNQGRFIEETLRSVKHQWYPHIEHIVVDGESTDDTLEILQRYEASYNLRWVSEPDQGQTDAINKGFAMTKGDIVGWLNSDDIYLTQDVVGTVVDAFRRTVTSSVIYGDSAILSKVGYILRIEAKPRFSYGHLLRDCFIDQPSVFFPREIIARHQLDVDLNYAMDYEYWLRLAREYPFRHLPRVLSGDRNHPDRKIIAERAAMKAESVEMQRLYGQSFGAAHKFGRLRDKVVSGGCRVKGLFEYLALRRQNDFACNVWTDGLAATTYRQLLMRNRDLAH